MLTLANRNEKIGIQDKEDSDEVSVMEYWMKVVGFAEGWLNTCWL
jgi:hypothetical protein